VTVLFTDLVGSTELLSELGEAAFDDLRRAHFAALRAEIERTGGEEVKTLGDGVLVVFGSAADAVSCAVAMQQAVDRQGRFRPAPLAIRVGLALGDVIFEEDDVFGTPVVEAARLVAAARGGQILTTALVRAVGGARSGAAFGDLGSIALKGLPAPVPICEVTWEPAVASAPLPALLTDVGPIFVGRDGELGRLVQLWKEAAEGERRIALLAGEPGVGKTRLAAELARLAHAEGAGVLAGRCDEDLGVPYQPFVEALRHFVDHAPADGLAEGLGRYGGELVRLVPEVADRVSGLAGPLRSDPETERYRLFDAVAAWLSAASVEEPLLLVLDDLQWAAKPTLMLLRHVVRADSGRVLVLGAYRDTELTHDHPLVEVVADLRRQGGVERLSLSGLDDVGVAAIVEQASGRPLDEANLALARAVYEETEGNPFFVREVLRHLAETGAVERQEDGWTTRVPIDRLGIPEGVREVVGHRLSRLSGDTNHALRIAAVVGPEFELRVVQAAGDVGEETLLGAVEEAAGARLITEVSATRFRFAHALVRATLYESLTAARKVILHRRVAEAIEAIHGNALDDHVPALAYHWVKASGPITDTSRAVQYLHRAGDRAMTQLAHDEAVAYYRQALELLDASGADPDDERRQELLIALGEAQRRSGDPAHRQTLLDAAHLAYERHDAHALVQAALANTREGVPSAAGRVDSDRVAVIEAGLAAIGDADTPDRARLLATLGLELTFTSDRERRTCLSDDALAMARRLGDASTIAHVLLARRYTIAAPGTLDERLENSAELVSVADRVGDPVLQAWAAWVRYRTTLESADVKEADRWLEVLDRITDDLRRPNLRWITVITRAGRLLLAGCLEEAERAIDQAWELGEACGQPDTPGFCGALECQLSLERGRPTDRYVVLSDSAARPEVSFSAAHAVLCLELGRGGEARRIFEGLAASRFTDLPLDTAWLPTLVQCATLATRLRYTEEARILHELLAPYRDQLCIHAVGVCLGSVCHYLGVVVTGLGRFDEADACFAAAEATHERLGARPWLTRTYLEWADMLLTRDALGDHERARGLLRQALATARELGLGSVERRAVTLLA